ncbi:MAG: hypothetical protein MRQ09_02040 [Candidatus Midichloria sp.]|nr:hypothetical protein [Candidatus Midichloria sp.]
MNFFTIFNVKNYSGKKGGATLCCFFLIFFLTIQKLEAGTTYREIETYFEYEELEQYLSIAQRIEIEKLSRRMAGDEKIFVTIQSFFYCEENYDKNLIEGEALRRAEEIREIFTKNGITDDRINIEIITDNQRKKNKVFIIRERGIHS